MTPAFAADKRRPQELHGYWAVQTVTVNGKDESGGEEGSFLIIRANGTYRVAKRGRKPEGSWEVNAENKLVLNMGDKPLMTATWSVKGDHLTLSFDERDNLKPVIKYVRKKLDKEPKAPDEK
jgi:hypothetical protein